MTLGSNGKAHRRTSFCASCGATGQSSLLYKPTQSTSNEFMRLPSPHQAIEKKRIKRTKCNTSGSAYAFGACYIKPHSGPRKKSPTSRYVREFKNPRVRRDNIVILL